jgi:hypothetical protein
MSLFEFEIYFVNNIYFKFDEGKKSKDIPVTGLGGP